jgi:hypothetical protein
MEKTEFEKRFNDPYPAYGRVIYFKSFGDIHVISYTFKDVPAGKVGLLTENGKRYDVPVSDIKKVL